MPQKIFLQTAYDDRGLRGPDFSLTFKLRHKSP